MKNTKLRISILMKKPEWSGLFIGIYLCNLGVNGIMFTGQNFHLTASLGV